MSLPGHLLNARERINMGKRQTVRQVLGNWIMTTQRFNSDIIYISLRRLLCAIVAKCVDIFGTGFAIRFCCWFIYNSILYPSDFCIPLSYIRGPGSNCSALTNQHGCSSTYRALWFGDWKRLSNPRRRNGWFVGWAARLVGLLHFLMDCVLVEQVE